MENFDSWDVDSEFCEKRMELHNANFEFTAYNSKEKKSGFF